MGEFWILDFGFWILDWAWGIVGGCAAEGRGVLIEKFSPFFRLYLES